VASIFFKPTYDATIENCLVNTAFIGEVNGGYYDSATDYRDCKTTLDQDPSSRYPIRPIL
jgi:hypothetical protein